MFMLTIYYASHSRSIAHLISSVLVWTRKSTNLGLSWERMCKPTSWEIDWRVTNVRKSYSKEFWILLYCSYLHFFYKFEVELS